MEASSSSDGTSRQDQVAHDGSENEISDSASGVVIGESTSNYKNKLHAGYNIPWLLPSPKTPSNRKMEDVIGDERGIKFKSNKQFDTVGDYSDHFYATEKVAYLSIQTGAKDEIKNDVIRKPTKEWVKRIQYEWKILEKDLPETISVRVYEDRTDLLRAVIIGPAGTPYEDGLFFFDAQFPDDYPDYPPKVFYHSGGLCLHPNLYSNGKVCLSLLGTWPGEEYQMWRPSVSTMLQVLVSIQALVLNEKPLFDEPLYEMLSNTAEGEKLALEYSKNAFMLSCKTMLYSIQNPLKHFEDFVAEHFRKQGSTILQACKSYIAEEEAKKDVDDDDGDAGEDSSSSRLIPLLQNVYDELLKELSAKGFLAQEVEVEVEAGSAATTKAADATTARHGDQGTIYC